MSEQLPRQQRPLLEAPNCGHCTHVWLFPISLSWQQQQQLALECENVCKHQIRLRLNERSQKIDSTCKQAINKQSFTGWILLYLNKIVSYFHYGLFMNDVTVLVSQELWRQYKSLSSKKCKCVGKGAKKLRITWRHLCSIIFINKIVVTTSFAATFEKYNNFESQKKFSSEI
jgi:hypothetical protein